LTPEGLRRAVVLVDGERIEGIVDAVPDDRPCEDLGDALLMPGLVDSHVHVNEPGRTEWEGYATATAAAAAGGITTLVDMPLNCIPVTTSGAAFEIKLAAAEEQLRVDCGFWGGVVPGNSGELAGMAAAVVLGFKAFLCHSGIDDFPAARRVDLLAAMPILRQAGVPLLVHAELDFGIVNPWADASPRDYLRYLHSRPKVWEDAAIAMMIDLVRTTGCAVHVVHLSSASALPMLRAARAEGLPITVETCPHYLCLRAEDVPTGDTAWKCAPPIRDSANQDGLWAGLRDGVIDFIVSDHSPCLPSLKLEERGDFMEAWGGIASLQFGLAGIWTEARRRGIAAERVVRWMSEEPARFLGLAGRKGSLRPGADADLVAWQPEETWTVESGQILHRHKVTPWLGRELAGRVERVWLRGQLLLCGGEIVQDAVRGRPLLRDPAGGAA
jgi:allantoinase